jgi:arylformamidase
LGLLYKKYENVDELNAQYDVEANPQTQVYVESFAARSAQARDEIHCQLDIPFGPTRAETFDVFFCDGGIRPAAFFVHGGWWRATTSKLWSYVAVGPLVHGITTVVTNYAHCPNVTVAEIVRQHRAAFASVWHRAEEFGIDRDNIVIAGHSAGGHAMAALSATDWEDYGLPAHPFRATVPISGVFDLLPVARCWLAPYLQLSLSEAVTLSYCEPLDWLPPTLAVVGGNESEEFIRQTCEWAESQQSAGLPANWEAVPGRDHFDILEELAQPDGLITKAILNFLH